MEQKKKKILDSINEAHAIIEETYMELRSLKEEQGKIERQRFLLADMACHLVQDAIGRETMELETLKNRLHSILVICDDFLPEKKLKLRASEIIS